MNAHLHSPVSIAVAQLNLTVGDLVGNADRIIAAVEKARAAGADLLLTPELALAGYPIIGEFRSYCGGHRMNIRILEALFADRANYAIVEAEPVYAPRAVQMAAGAPMPAALAPDLH